MILNKGNDAYRKDSAKKSINWDKPDNKNRKLSTSAMASKDKQC